MTTDREYQEWLEEESQSWDVDEMVGRIAATLSMDYESVCAVVQELGEYECAEQALHLIEQLRRPHPDAVGIHNGGNE